MGGLGGLVMGSRHLVRKSSTHEMRVTRDLSPRVPCPTYFLEPDFGGVCKISPVRPCWYGDPPARTGRAWLNFFSGSPHSFECNGLIATVTRDHCRAMQKLRSAIKRISGPTVCGPDCRSLAFSQALQGRRTPRRRCRRIALLCFRPELSGYKPRSGDQCCLRPTRSPQDQLQLRSNTAYLFPHIQS